ncbi:SDR family oxidoreductase [Pseudomonas syringae pv. tagetis]|uniref:SDR family oxidoreductase n=1 Tax=Pseudomonas syringae pv. tagetis TaxID=129140 RepID=A0ABW7NLZ3_9PSED|nr:SDR family oxidoreductase [Pseudomonas syringae group genomosp. 7]UNB66265.1 SDR family oxidoreductase [Pseudomonas syringae pv. tagetis]
MIRTSQRICLRGFARVSPGNCSCKIRKNHRSHRCRLHKASHCPPCQRGQTRDQVGALAALLLGPEGSFITGSDFLMDGGVTARTGTAIWPRNSYSPLLAAW